MEDFSWIKSPVKIKYVPNLSNDNPYKICNTLWSSQTYFHNCVGFCHRHGKYMTEKQLKKKGCLGKQCNCLLKIETHEYWEQRKKKKELKNVSK